MPRSRDPITIRRAAPAEAAAVARFHVEVWRETYRDIAPADAYALLDEARRLPGWQAALEADRARQDTLLAVSSGAIVGLVHFGPPHHEIFGKMGEIRQLYVDRRMRGSGLGRRLVGEAFARIRRAGYAGAGLAVVCENMPARRFYRALGGMEIREFQDPGPLWKSANILMAWPPDALVDHGPER